MIRWNTDELWRLMRAAGIANPKQLADATALRVPTAYAIFNRGVTPIERLDCFVLVQLAKHFGVSPWSLLIYEPE